MSDSKTIKRKLHRCRSVGSVPSMVKWTGSKRAQVSQIVSLAPEFQRYFEPFLGGGAMLFAAAHPGAIANDIYEPLIQLWKLVRDNPDQLVDHYRTTWNELSCELESIDISKMTRGNGLPATFYRVRDRFNANPNSKDLNFLMRTCVNGIVRFNANGHFNNSFHLSRKGMQPNRFAEIVSKWNKTISGVDFLSKDYREILDMTKTGDFVYLDPPYAGTSQRYIERLSPEELFAELDALNSKGVKWMLSYDGKRGDNNLTYDVPRSIYQTHRYIHNGNSAVVKVLSGSNERVEEGLYMNF